LTEYFDVAVEGGGPAGSVLALRLIQLGKRVVLIEKTREFGPRPGESLTPDLVPLLETVDLRERVEAAGFLKPRAAQILWAGESRLKDASVFIVDRMRLDSLLLDHARDAGVRVMRPARIIDRRFSRMWSLQLEGGRAVTAGLLADATGRNHVRAAPAIQYGARTFALCGYWSEVCANSGEVIVEAGSSAWYWGASLDDGIFSAMAFVDTAAVRPQQYSCLLDASKLLRPRLKNARCIQQKVCDATPFLDTASIDERSIKVGEAALSIDPLSSQGVQIAIGTAIHAAAVVNTILDQPRDHELAMDFYRRRTTQSAEFHATAAKSFYREQFNVTATDFWRMRADWPLRSALPAPRYDNEILPPETRVCIPAHVRFVRIGASDGCHIFSEDAAELDGNVVAYVQGVKLRDLLELLSHPAKKSELIARWTAYVGIEKAHQIFRWAWAWRWIEVGDTAQRCEFVNTRTTNG
jgi:flavin-dependent dehydrogenase